MLKILHSCIFCFILVGCVQNTPDEEWVESTRSIDFNVYMGHQAKAAEKVTFEEGNSFLVFAHRSSMKNSEVSDLFDGDYFRTASLDRPWVCVTKQPSGLLTLDRKVFWPQDSYYLDFISVMQNTPTSAYTLSFAPATLTFQQTENVTEQHDLLLSVATGKQYSPNPVQMLFRHTLSKLQFLAQIESSESCYMAKVLSVEAKGVKMKGDYCFTGSNSIGTAGTWSVDGLSVAVDCAASLLPLELKGNIVTTITAADGALMLIPQPATALNVEYELYNNIGTEELPSYELIGKESRTVDLTGTHWLPGTLYSYVIKIKPESEIKFSCDMEKWKDETTNEQSPVYPPQPL